MKPKIAETAAEQKSKLFLEQAPENVLTFELKTPEGGKTYSLVMDYRAIIRAEEKTGINFASPFNWKNLSAENLSVILWASFLKYHPKVSLEDVQTWIPPADYSVIFASLIELCHPGFLDMAVEALKKEKVGENQPSPV